MGSPEDFPGAAGTPVRREATIVNTRGLHARAAAKFVKVAGRYDADITVANRCQEVCGRSIMGLMMLAAAPGTTLEIRGAGRDAEEAVSALCRLIDDRFHED